MTRPGLTFVAAAVAIGLLATGQAPAQPARAGESTVQEVKDWLDRMNDSVETLSYRGSFEHRVRGQDAENLEIVHRYADGEVIERISSPAAGGREILRTPHFVRSVFPEKRLVVIEEPEVATVPTAAILHYTSGLENYYELSTFPGGRIAGRDTLGVLILQRDGYRYGYLLKLDLETALPLYTAVRDNTHYKLEEIEFTEISVVDAIPDGDLALRIDTADFEIRRPDRNNNEPTSGEIWTATQVPIGFTLSVFRSTLLAGSRYPVQHLVYTDGLATVSVFISHPLSDADMPEGYSRAGSTNMYASKIDGRLAVAVGEVPKETVHFIVTSLDAR